MNFGVPSQKRQKVEKYPNDAVMTIVGYTGQKGAGRKIEFNSTASEKLGFTDDKAEVAFSFDGGLFVANANQQGIPSEHAIKVTKNSPRKISDKRTYEYIIKTQGLDETLDNEYFLSQTIQNGITLFKATLVAELQSSQSDEGNDVDAEFEAVAADWDAQDLTLDNNQL